jgi:hypothetical protein
MMFARGGRLVTGFLFVTVRIGSGGLIAVDAIVVIILVRIGVRRLISFSLGIVDDLRCSFTRFKLNAHSLKLRRLLFHCRGERFHSGF